MPTRNSHYDVVIAGARCAGAATAMLLARQGARVLVLDRSRYGTDTLSTHALMRGGVRQLHRWGLLPRVIAAGTPAIRSTTLQLPGGYTAVWANPLGEFVLSDDANYNPNVGGSGDWQRAMKNH